MTSLNNEHRHGVKKAAQVRLTFMLCRDDTFMLVLVYQTASFANFTGALNRWNMKFDIVVLN